MRWFFRLLDWLFPQHPRDYIELQWTKAEMAKMSRRAPLQFNMIKRHRDKAVWDKFHEEDYKFNMEKWLSDAKIS